MENVHTSLRHVYLILKAMGLFPYSYYGPFRTGVLKQSFSGVLASFLSFGVWITLFLINMFGKSRVPSPSRILGLAWTASLIISYFNILAAFTYQIFKKDSIIKYIQLLEEFDRKVKSQFRP